MSPSYYETPTGRRLAYVHTPHSSDGAGLPTVVFLGGFKSDMEGTKATHLEQLCADQGQEFLRFDYSGHGQSDGAFVDGTIGAWKQDAIDIMDHVLKGRRAIVIGSSMGGWIALRLLSEGREDIKGVIGIAAAPDFTKDIENKMSEAEKEMMNRIGRLEVPNDYSDEPYIFTQALLKDGAHQSVLDQEHVISVPLVLIQGKLDVDVPWEKALKIEEKFQGPDTKIIFIEDGDHSLSRPQDLSILSQEVKRLSEL